MPFTFTQISGTGDALPNNRHTLYFPRLPTAADGKELTLRHTTVTLPAWDVGHIITKIYGWSVGFAGRRTTENTFNVEFIETTDAPVIKILLNWQKMVHGFTQPNTSLKSQYAVNCKCVAADTTGKFALTCKMYNIFPQSIKMADFEEDSGALHISVVFSVDAVDIESLDYSTETALSSAGFVQPVTSFNIYPINEISNAINKVVDTTNAAFNISQQVINSLNLTKTNINNLFTSFF